jgi:hypothetical protein
MLIPVAYPLNLLKKQWSNYLNFLCLFCLHQSANTFSEYKILTGQLVNTKLLGFHLLWGMIVYVIGHQNCPTLIWLVSHTSFPSRTGSEYSHPHMVKHCFDPHPRQTPEQAAEKQGKPQLRS